MGQEDIRLSITGDIKQGEATVKKAKKLIKSLDKVAKASNARRKKYTEDRAKRVRRAEENIKAVKLRNIQRLMALDAKAARDRRREEVRQERLAAKEKERILKAHQRRRRSIAGRQRRAIRTGAAIGGIGGIGVLFKARDILDYQVALARVSAQAGISAKEQLKLKDGIDSSAVAFGVQRNKITDAVTTIVNKSGDMSLAAENLENISKLIRGTGAEANDVGQLYASVKNAFKGSGNDLKNSEVAEFIEILVAQGDKAQITIADLASEGEKLFGAFKGAGLRSKEDFVSFGALVQTAGEAGGPAEAATSAARFLSELTKQQGKLRKKGVEIFKPGSKGELKSLDSIIKSILKNTKGDVTELQDVFTERAIKPLKILAAEYRSTGGEVKSFTDLLDLGANATDNIQKKYDRVAQTSAQGFARMGAAFEVLLDKALTNSLNEIADSISKMLDNEDAMKTLKLTFEAIGKTLVLAAKVPGFFGKIGQGLGAGLAGRDVSNIRFQQAEKSRVLRSQIQRNVLQNLPNRTPDQDRKLQDLNVFINNNIDSDGNFIIDVKAEQVGQTEEKVKTLYAGKLR